MSKGINKVTLIGNLGNNPEIRHTTEGAAVTTIVVATSEAWKDKQTGEFHERAEWHRVVLHKRLAEIAGEYLKKGALIYVEGKLRTKKYCDKYGIDRYSTEIIAHELKMLGSSKDKVEHSLSKSVSKVAEDIEDDIPF